MWYTNTALAFGGLHHSCLRQGFSLLSSSTWRMVSWEMLSMNFNCKTWSASKRRFQRVYPSGRWTINQCNHPSFLCAIQLAAIYVIDPTWFQKSLEPFKYKLLPNPFNCGNVYLQCFADFLVLLPSSAFKRILACVNVRAFDIPEPISDNSFLVSSVFKVMMYLLALAFLFSESILPFLSPITPGLTLS